MYAIAARHKPGTSASAKTAPISNIDAIEKWWQGRGNDALMQEKLQALHADAMWIACSCTKDRANPPLMTVVFDKSRGRYHLQRLTDRAEHTADCIYRFDKRDTPADDNEQASASSNPRPLTVPSFLLDQAALDAPDLVAAKPRKSSAASNEEDSTASRLGRQLLWLLDAAGMQTWPQTGVTPAQALLNLAQQVNLKQGLKLSDILFCKADAWKKSWVQGAFDRCTKAKLPPQAIVICPVVEANKTEGWVRFSKDEDPTPVAGRIWASDEGSPARYPMLMCARVVRTTGQPARIAQAYLHPIHTINHWMAVDSNLEREALDVLISACLTLEQKGVNCRIEKPVFDWGETGARPDFVVQGQGKSKNEVLMIETMGFNNPDYLDRKKLTVQKLAGYQVFEDGRYAKDDKTDHNLMRYVIGFLGQLAK